MEVQNIPTFVAAGRNKCYFYITDGWKVHQVFIPDGDQIVIKTSESWRLPPARK